MIQYNHKYSSKRTKFRHCPNELILYNITQLIYTLKRYKITITDNFIIINRQVYLIFFLSGEMIMKSCRERCSKQYNIMQYPTSSFSFNLFWHPSHTLTCQNTYSIYKNEVISSHCGSTLRYPY